METFNHIQHYLLSLNNFIKFKSNTTIILKQLQALSRRKKCISNRLHQQL